MGRDTHAAGGPTPRSTYPDPAQLRAYADEPMPFIDILPRDFELTNDGLLVGSHTNIEHRYHPTYILVENAPGTWDHVENIPECGLTHTEAWDRAIDVQIEEDFICVTEFTDVDGEPAQFDAYWVLDEVRIGNPELRPNR